MSDLIQEEADQRALEWLDFECERDYFGQRDAINLRRLIERLHERLEMTHAWQMIDGKMTGVTVPAGSIPDGIECRDETIRQQDKEIERLRMDAASYRSGMDINAEQTKKTPDIDWGEDMKPGAIIEWKCPQFGDVVHRWRVLGVHLGAVGQESLIEMESLTHKPGWTGEWEWHPRLWIPEVLMRHLPIVEPAP